MKYGLSNGDCGTMSGGREKKVREEKEVIAWVGKKKMGQIVVSFSLGMMNCSYHT